MLSTDDTIVDKELLANRYIHYLIQDNKHVLIKKKQIEEINQIAKLVVVAAI